MSSVTFNTLEFLNTLKFSGIGDKQAEAITQAVKKSHDSIDVATKKDLELLKKDLIIKLGSLVIISVTIATTILGLLISIKLP